MIDLPFSHPLWFPTIAITLLVGSVIIVIGMSLSTREDKIIFTRFIGVLLFVRFIFMHAYEVGVGDWSIHVNLPLHLCGLSSILSLIVMIRYNQKMFNFIALIGIPSAIHSILTPQWTNTWVGYSFRFYDYYLSHGAILFVPIFLMFVLGYKITQKSWKEVFIQCLVFSFFVGIFNWIAKTLNPAAEKLANYLYLCKAPDIENPLIITKEWPHYIPIIIFMGLLHILFFYYFFNMIKKVSND